MSILYVHSIFTLFLRKKIFKKKKKKKKKKNWGQNPKARQLWTRTTPDNIRQVNKTDVRQMGWVALENDINYSFCFQKL